MQLPGLTAAETSGFSGVAKTFTGTISYGSSMIFGDSIHRLINGHGWEEAIRQTAKHVGDQESTAHSQPPHPRISPVAEHLRTLGLIETATSGCTAEAAMTPRRISGP